MILEKRWLDAKEIIDKSFPKICFGFGYGSGVLKQSDYDYKSNNFPMIDFVFVVDDVKFWLEQNHQKNKEHYTGPSKAFGPKYSYGLIRNQFPMAFYPNINLQSLDAHKKESSNIAIKYGIISKKDFLRDQTDWEIFSMSGRLHKPVRFFNLDKEDFDIQNMLSNNLTSAQNTSIILNSSETNRFMSQENILLEIIGLSYMGEIRTYLKAESSNKRQKILAGSKDKLIDLYYKPITKFLEQHDLWIIDKKEGKVLQNGFMDLIKQRNLNEFLIEFPTINSTENSTIVRDLYMETPLGKRYYINNQSDLDIKNTLIKQIKRRNLSSSSKLSLMGIQSISLKQNLCYGINKLKKGLK